jgi:hypothetical protein
MNLLHRKQQPNTETWWKFKKSKSPVPKVTLHTKQQQQSRGYAEAAERNKQKTEDSEGAADPFIIVPPRKVEVKPSRYMGLGWKSNLMYQAQVNSLISELLQEKTHIYVGRLHPTSTEEAVKAHLQVTASITDAEVKKVDSKSEYKSQYAAYHISCSFNTLETIKDPSIWPEGTIINKFFFKRHFQMPKNSLTPTLILIILTFFTLTLGVLNTIYNS